MPINVDLLKKDNIKFSFFENDKCIEKNGTSVIGEGDFVYALGFPMGLVGEKRNMVIVRSGSIARMDKNSKTFLIDAFIFPGNSGGPVILKPELLAIQGTQPSNTAYLLGVIKSFISYQDTAISRQTNEVRVIFSENSGLAEVIPIIFVDKAIQEFLQTI
jgi:S1-C subfamily serine protease